MKVYPIAITFIFSIAGQSTAFTVLPSSTSTTTTTLVPTHVVPSGVARSITSHGFSSKHGPTTALSLTSTSTSTSALASTSTTSSTSSSSLLFPQPRRKTLHHLTATALSPMDDSSSSSSNKGLFTFQTKFGYLNPFAIYYGLTSILLGLPWFVVLTMCQIMYKITNNAWDKMRRVPIFFSHIWGVLLLRLTRSYPTVEGMEILDKFYKEGRTGMFVANHNSWMDIPFMGVTVGWRNYKLISKAELGKVPILGKAIALGGHVMVDRSDRKSQLKTLKMGMQWLKDGVHLCAFPEGTRSKTGRLLPFKNGAFKMAHKVGAPIVPLSIVASGKAHPSDWMFPRMKSHGVCKVIVHEPIESEGRTEEELAELVRNAIIDGLPEDQRPLPDE
eukprot:CAMPEP_0176496084 /NCGR_PEP_ID=MMETSP0200_2-20121128/11009_1 /TAXON_ID=947934 /ORGANISM="Chaetoceros sp., Strain GSL56" /LENGTH=387 /DNA_ID=CAMNT_0017894021 /DNA_START=163 /DNA_END=1326 /DNA_ORIENTATION=+